MQHCQAQMQSQEEAADSLEKRLAPASKPYSSTSVMTTSTLQRPVSVSKMQSEGASVGPSDSNLSDITQGPTWLQRWAALLMPQDSEDQSQASMQQWMTNITVAMQQAQREGMQLPPAQEVLASLMSLASVQSPALTPTTDVVSKRPPLSTEEGQKLATKALQSRVWSQAQAQPSTGVSKLPEKRMQPVPAEGEPQKVARTGQTTPRGEAPSATAGGQSHWYRPRILIQQRSNSEPRDMLGLSAKSAEPQRSAAKSHFRVYSNAFQEPLPAPRWAVSKSARGKSRDEARSNASSDHRFRPQIIVTGASRNKDPDAADKESHRRAGPWTVASPPPSANPTPSATPKPQPDPVPQANHDQQPGQEPLTAPRAPYDFKSRMAPTSDLEDRGGQLSGLPFPPFRPEQAAGGMEGQVAAAWLRQRYMANPLLMQEAHLNPYAGPDVSAFANALSKMPLQAAQQLQGGMGGLAGHSGMAQFMHLQHLAQSLGSSTGLNPWQLQSSHSVPPPSYPSQEQWRDGMHMQAKAGHHAGPAKVYYQHTWPADKDSVLVRRPFVNPGKESMAAHRDSRATIKQPVPRRPLPDQQRSSPGRQSPGQAIDARTHLEQMVFLHTGSARSGLPYAVADLPTDRSWSTPAAHPHDLGSEPLRAPSTDSSLTELVPAAVDINNPFEVHREQLALDFSPTKDPAKGFVKPTLTRHKSPVGNDPSRMPAFQPVVPPSMVAKASQGSQSPPARKSEPRSSSSPSSGKRASKTEDEEIAAQTLLSLFVPTSLDQGITSNEVAPEGSIHRRPRSHRPKGRR